MPNRIVSFFHPSVVDGNLSLTTGFAPAVHHAHDLRANAIPGVQNQRFRERVEGVRVRLSAVGTATKITMRISLDAGGDECVVPDVEATIATGLTTAATGAVAYSVKVPLYQSVTGEIGKLYIHLKADAACTVNQTTITWTET
jgi:hypothetical protein